MLHSDHSMIRMALPPLEKVLKQAVRGACRVRWNELLRICWSDCHVLSLLSWPPVAHAPPAQFATYHCDTFIFSFGLEYVCFTIASLSKVRNPLRPHPFSHTISNPHLHRFLTWIVFHYSGTNYFQVFVIFTPTLLYLFPLRISHLPIDWQ